MTPKSFVVSLEWAKKLKEAGWPQEESILYWNDWGETNGYECRKDWYVSEESWVDCVSAPTAEEILRRLPGEIMYIQGKCYLKINHLGRGSFYLNIKRANPKRMENGERIRLPKSVWSTENDTLANAAAAMYCFLAENNFLPPTS